MNVLVINCGTSSVRFQVASVEPDAGGVEGHQILAQGTVDGIGREAVLCTGMPGRTAERRTVWPATHETAVRRVIEWCRESGLAIEAVGHRVAHGGESFTRATVVDESVVPAMEILLDVAPIHNAPGLSGVRAARAVLGAAVPMVAVFDTAFHLTMPERACLYALPRETGRRLGIRRYGFHGISYKWLVGRYSKLAGIAESRATFVAFHLGDGCSAAAIAGGRSIDTSMGLTPLEGLVMETRSGDIDASVVTYLARTQGLGLDQIERMLNEDSGLKGISGMSQDVRELLAREKESAGARLALDLFCYRARKYLGAYLAALGGADAVVFSGAIGDSLPAIRARICDGMQWCGLVLDAEANRRALGDEVEISARNARVRTFVIPSDEEQVIARETAACLRQAASYGRTSRAART